PGKYGYIYSKLSAYAKAHNQEETLMHYKGKGVSKPMTQIIDSDSLRNSVSLLEYMRWLNSPAVQQSSQAAYINMYPQIGYLNVYHYQDNYLAGTGLTADWYRRNIYIYSKMINQLSYDEDAIFLLIGND